MVRAARLRRSVDIELVCKEGRSVRKDTFNARVRRTNEPDVRVAVVAPRSVGSAVARNRARRRVREAFRIATTSGRPTSGLDIVVSARREALVAPFPQLRDEAATVLDGERR